MIIFLIANHLNGPNVTLNCANGAELGKLLYRPWGETRVNTGTPLTTWRFTGQREDATIGLYFYGARFYDPLLGRFLSADTIVPNPGDPQSLNRYSYTLNNPIKYRDPSGHAFASPEGGGSGAIAIAAGYALASQLGQALNVAVADAQAFFQQLGNLTPAVGDQLANRGQVRGPASGPGGNAAGSGGPDPNDPWGKFNKLLGQGKSEIDAAVEATTQGKGDRFVIGPFKPDSGSGILNYIEEANANGGKYFNAGTKLWDELASKGLTAEVNERVIVEQMRAGIGRIDISSGMTIGQILADPMKFSSLYQEVGWIEGLAGFYGYVQNAAGTGWIKL